MRRHLIVLLAGFILGTVWISPVIAGIINADTVNGIGASRAPVAGKLLALNNNKKLPNTVLRTGHGKGLNADKVDGQHGSAFVKRAAPVWAVQTRHFSVSPAAWTLMSQDTTSPDSVGNRDFSVYDANGTKGITAPVNLPDGARITKVKLVYSDSDGVDDLDAALFSRRLDTNTLYWDMESSWLHSAGSAGGLASTETVVNPPTVIDNVNRSHRVIVYDSNSSDNVIGVVITYTITGP